jgi:hypothetical protein
MQELQDGDNEDDIDTSYDLNTSKHVDAIIKAAKECMSHFFCDKHYWAGGSIPRSKLFREEYVKVVMEMNVLDAISLAYFCLNKNPPDTVSTGKKGWDVELCYECLQQCGVRFIPKCHAGGMLLVYLALCHGVDFLPTIKKLSEIKAMISKREKEMEMKSSKD